MADRRQVESQEDRSSRQEQNRLNIALSREIETPEERTRRQEKDRLKTAQRRKIETPQSCRLNKVQVNISTPSVNQFWCETRSLMVIASR